MASKMTQLGMMGVPDIIYRKAVKDWSTRELVASFAHLGAGVQSSTIAYMVLAGELPAPTAFLFADTGNEPEWVYQQVEYLSGLGLNIERVSRPGDGILIDTMERKHGRFATMPLYTRNPDTGKIGQMRRQCTKEYKIEPLEGWIRGWLIAHGHGKVVIDKNGQSSRRIDRDVYVEDWYGISADEIERMSDRGAQWQKATYPLIDMNLTRAECVKWCVSHGFKVPRKSACMICPFHDDEYWLDMQQNRPQDFEEVCKFDDWLRTEEAQAMFMRNMKQPVYVHRSCRPLRDIDFAEEIKQRAARPLLDMCGAHCMT